MDCHSAGHFTSWVDLFNTDHVVTAARPGHALVVDIGSSKGHDIEKFLQKHPTVPKESLILQDLPEVLQKFTIDPGITRDPHRSIRRLRIDRCKHLTQNIHVQTR
ncbi:hypothetical protein F4860DRAFT_518315 [Xylaria cubensis]|nr:hypothetical protein F4860DRAFT_518315 [Xylaria cubensis]